MWVNTGFNFSKQYFWCIILHIKTISCRFCYCCCWCSLLTILLSVQLRLKWEVSITWIWQVYISILSAHLHYNKLPIWEICMKNSFPSFKKNFLHNSTWIRGKPGVFKLGSVEVRLGSVGYFTRDWEVSITSTSLKTPDLNIQHTVNERNSLYSCTLHWNCEYTVMHQTPYTPVNQLSVSNVRCPSHF